MAHDPRYRLLVLEQGVTNSLTFRLEHPDGTLIDPVTEGYTAARLEVRSAHLSEGGELLLALTTDNGGIVLGSYDDGSGTTWSGYLYVSQAVAAELVPWGEGVYDLLLTHTNGQVHKAAYGPAVLVPVVSEVS